MRVLGELDESRREVGEERKAKDWLQPQGRARKLRNALVTDSRHLLPAVVVVKQKSMKDAWFLASLMGDDSATDIIKLYGRRFTIVPFFRDVFGLV
jgi:hypothetical protein